MNSVPDAPWATEADLHASLQSGALTWPRMLVVAICALIVMVDGYDMLAIAFVAHEISREWQVPPVALGGLFSAGLLGMVGGSLLLAPLADRFGRRPAILSGLAAITAGMAASSQVDGIGQMAAARLVTGLGVGMLQPSLNTVVAEVMPADRRALAVALAAAGYPAGAVLGGAASYLLMDVHGWRSVFVMGAALSLACMALVWAMVPESIAFLLGRRPADALARVNRSARMLRLPSLAALQGGPDLACVRPRIWNRAFAISCLLVAFAFFSAQLTFYFVMTWTPKIMIDAGLDEASAISVSMLMNFGGVLGGAVFSLVARRSWLPLQVAVFAVITFALVALLPHPQDLALLYPLAFCTGMAFFGVTSGLYAIVAEIFPVETRMTGTGLSIGMGRMGAVAGPGLAGLMIAAGWEADRYFLVLAAPMILSAAVILSFRRQFATLRPAGG